MLREQFDRYFEIVAADTPELLRTAYTIRYQVYCVENPFESTVRRAGALETDAFDSRAIHSLIIHRETGNAAGTVRLVLPDKSALDRSFALQQLVDPKLIEALPDFPPESTAELSRFSISKTFRRRAGDGLYGEDPDHEEARADRRSGPLMRLGLMQAILAMSRKANLTHWCAVMEPALLRILAGTHIRFYNIGGPVEYHGLRQPCYGNIEAILAELKATNPDVWDLVTVGGALCQGAPWLQHQKPSQDLRGESILG